VDSLVLVLSLGHLLIPILGLLYYGIRTENKRQERMLRNAIKALGLKAVKSGNGQKLNS
jgi:hypothetical protein